MFSTISAILWKTLINNDAAGGASSFSRKGRGLIPWYFRKNKRNGGVPLICQPAAATFPQGKALAWCNCRGPYNHQGSAPKRGNRGTVTPLHPSAAQSNDTNGTRLPIIGSKGVLRTLVLSEFSPSRSEVFRSATERSEALGAEMVTFCSFKKSPAGGRTRDRTPVGYRQKRPSPSSEEQKRARRSRQPRGQNPLSLTPCSIAGEDRGTAGPP